MASIISRNGKFCVVYKCKNSNGETKQKWETYTLESDAIKRKKEIEYKMSVGTFEIPNCKLLRELLSEYVELYGKEKWALSTYSGNVSLIRNYIEPLIGNMKIQDISIRFLEKFYKELLETPAVATAHSGKEKKMVSASTIRDIHKLLRSCFNQAVKWELIEKNPAEYATVPKYKAKKRDIWTAETLMQVLDVCDDEMLRLSFNLSFAGSLRIGELIGLTWDNVDISEEAIRQNEAYIYIDKEVERVSKEAMRELDEKDVILVFPSKKKNATTSRVLKKPKTECSIRKVYLPASVARSLVEWKEKQDEIKEFLGDEYQDFNLVMATTYGLPIGDSFIRDKMNEHIERYNLPKVVFHSLRHTSVTYKLKLNGGDIKAVQGDSGHAQVNMVTDVYSHIIDEDRRKNAELFENAFYKKENINPQMNAQRSGTTMTVPDGIDPELLAKVLSNPETAALLTALAKSIQKC